MSSRSSHAAAPLPRMMVDIATPFDYKHRSPGGVAVGVERRPGGVGGIAAGATAGVWRVRRAGARRGPMTIIGLAWFIIVQRHRRDPAPARTPYSVPGSCQMTWVPAGEAAYVLLRPAKGSSGISGLLIRAGLAISRTLLSVFCNNLDILIDMSLKRWFCVRTGHLPHGAPDATGALAGRGTIVAAGDGQG